MTSEPMATTVPTAASREALGGSAVLRTGIAVGAALILFRTVGGNFANEWEGWGTFLSTAAAVTVEGAVWVALTFGLLVRIGLRPTPGGHNRPARAALLGGVLSILSFAVFFTGAPVIVGAGAVMLALAGLRWARSGIGGRGAALAGLVLGALTITGALAFYITAIVDGVLTYWV
jgi:hypothetical protein